MAGAGAAGARCPGCGRGHDAPASACSCGRFAVAADVVERGSGDPALGREVLGRFVLLGPIAYGARSTVHAALDRRSGDGCIVKLIREEGEGGAALRALVREAELLAGAPPGAAPAVRAVGVETIATADPALPLVVLAALALDRIDGEPFDDAFAKVGADRVGLARALLATLGRLHEAGIVHGDLKPVHARVTESGDVVLLDLGSGSRAAARPACPPAVQPADDDDAATPAYAAPERSEGPSVASDLFGWGRVVARAAGGSLDGALAQAVARATAADPAARPASAAALLAALPAP